MRNSDGRGDRRGWLLTGALFAPLVLLLAVAAMTWRTERRYAVVTDRVVHDYAALGAWQYARRASTRLHDEAMAAFQRVAEPGAHLRTGPRDSLVSPTLLLTGETARSAFLRGARFAFSFARANDQLTTSSRIDPRTRDMLAGRLRGLARNHMSRDEPHQVIFDTSSGQSHAIALWTLHKPDGPAIGVYGVVADPAALRPMFARLITESELLPALAGSSFTEDDVAVRLTRRDGGVVFQSRRPLGRTAALDTVGLQGGELRATVDLAPHVASALLVGGAPPSQLPAVALMIALSTVLAIVALLHQKRLRELQRVRERFVANVSHELRTPLAQISMFAETLALARERSPAERRDFASIIFAEARRLTTLVERVLHFSRSDERQRQQLHLETTSLGEEIAGAIQLFMPIAREGDVTVNVALQHDVRARLDRHAFRQIMLNLLDNAMKHGGRGTIVEVSTAERDGDVLVAVDDNGPGIPGEWRQRVFEPFSRMERSKVAGAGIGLSVVRDLVSAHGGRVWIESSALGGARFVVVVPAVPDSATTIDTGAALDAGAKV
jgi:signal transduction histidine kinase